MSCDLTRFRQEDHSNHAFALQRGYAALNRLSPLFSIYLFAERIFSLGKVPTPHFHVLRSIICHARDFALSSHRRNILERCVRCVQCCVQCVQCAALSEPATKFGDFGFASFVWPTLKIETKVGKTLLQSILNQRNVTTDDASKFLITSETSICGLTLDCNKSDELAWLETRDSCSSTSNSLCQNIVFWTGKSVSVLGTWHHDWRQRRIHDSDFECQLKMFFGGEDGTF